LSAGVPWPLIIFARKSLTKWKHALGQVLAYSTYYLDRAKVIHLYVPGDHTPKLKEHLRVCAQFEIAVAYQNLLTSELGPMSRLSEIVAAA